MKYIIRAIKYFIYIAIILTLVIVILSKMRMLDGGIENIFVNGYKSLYQIAAVLAVFSALYPRLGYSTRGIRAYGSYAEIRPAVLQVMEDHGYRLESEDGENLTFVKRAPLARALKMWEDRLTFTRSIDGFQVEGLTREIVRVASAIEYKTRGGEE